MNPDFEQYKIIVESSPNMIWRSGTDALCDYFNLTWLNFTGRTFAEEVGNGWAEGVHAEDLEACIKIYLEAFAKREPFEMEYRLKRKDGEWRWINDRGTPFYNSKHEFGGYIGSCVDVTDKVEGRRLREMAQVDGLTGIYNRQYFEQLARVAFRKFKDEKQNLCLVMIDIDRFKQINDKHGHQAGDMVLSQVAQALKGCIRETDIVGRYGGDEFVVLMSNTNLSKAKVVIARCEQEIESLIMHYGKSKINVTASFGIKQATNEESLDKLICKADIKLYEKKAYMREKLQ